MKKHYFLIFIIALLLRLGVLYELRHVNPISNGTDMLTYYNQAIDFTHGQWPTPEPFFYHPLVPLIILLSFKFFGISTLAPQLLNCIISALSCPILAAVGVKLFDRKTGLVAGWLLAFYQAGVFYSTVILDVPFTTLALVVSLWAVSNPNLRISLITGLILSLGILGRGTLLISAISIIGWLIIKRQYLAGVTMSLTLILCLMPIVARNAAYGAPAITTNAPINLWIGNNPDANGTYNIHKGGEAYAITTAIAESDGKWLNHIMEYIRTQPLDWLQLTLQKAVMFFFLPDGFMPHNVFLVFEGLKNSWLLRFLPGYGIFVTLTFAGVIKLRKRRHEFIPLAVIYIPYSVTTIAFFITTGYRVPITTILILFASATIVDIVSKIKRSHTISRAIPT